MKKFIEKRPYLMFLLPGIIVYSVFVVYPILSAGYISFFRWNGYGPKEFVGLQNYRELFTNVNMMSQLGNALKNCLTIFLLSVIIMMPIQIIMAYIIHAKSRGSGFFQVAVFSPQFISTPVIVFIFTLLFDGSFGIVNKILRETGLGNLARPWMGIPEYGIYVVWFMMTWAGMGVGMVYFIGAMKMISHEILESAYVDGAGFWKRLWYIVLPQSKGTIFNIVLTSYIISMTVFDFNYILGGSGGGISGSVDTLALMFYRTAFGENSPLGGKVSVNAMGMGTTIACVLFLMVFVVAIIQIILMFRTKKED